MHARQPSGEGQPCLCHTPAAHLRHPRADAAAGVASVSRGGVGHNAQRYVAGQCAVDQRHGQRDAAGAARGGGTAAGGDREAGAVADCVVEEGRVVGGSSQPAANKVALAAVHWRRAHPAHQLWTRAARRTKLPEVLGRSPAANVPVSCEKIPYIVSLACRMCKPPVVRGCEVMPEIYLHGRRRGSRF